MSNPIVIFDSARPRGDTWKAIEKIFPENGVPIVELRGLNISHYDYEHKNQEDDFLPLMEKVLAHDPIILASPVYWYSMSAVMKTFIERWSDLLDLRKDLRKKLVGKNLFVVTSYGGQLPQEFDTPIRLTCQYLGVNYGGCYFHYSGTKQQEKENSQSRAEGFRTKIQSLQ